MENEDDELREIRERAARETRQTLGAIFHLAEDTGKSALFNAVFHGADLSLEAMKKAIEEGARDDAVSEK